MFEPSVACLLPLPSNIWALSCPCSCWAIVAEISHLLLLLWAMEAPQDTPEFGSHSSLPHCVAIVFALHNNQDWISQQWRDSLFSTGRLTWRAQSSHSFKFNGTPTCPVEDIVTSQPCLEIRTYNLTETRVAWMGNIDSACESLGVMMTKGQSCFHPLVPRPKYFSYW